MMKKRLEACSRCGSLVEVPDGSALRDARRSAGLSLREFGARLHLTASYLCDVELNRRRVTPALEVAYGSLRKAKR